MTENDRELPLSSLLPTIASKKRRGIRLRRNPPPPLPDQFSKLIDDLIIEILIRLPNPRSSCRCKPVCKRWRSLISDPTFNRRFVSHHQNRYRPASLFLPAHDPDSVLDFLPVPDEARRKLRVFDCFQDLLLCGFVKFTCELRRSYFICNPFTKQWIALPLQPELPPHIESAAGLVCRARSCWSNYNLLGGEPEPPPFVCYSEYRFRVVCLFQLPLSCQVLLVFCSESGKWKEMNLEHYAKVPLGNALTWNGKLFWVQYDLNNYCSVFAMYDPFRPYKLPGWKNAPYSLWRYLSNGDGNGNFSISQGALHIIVLEAGRPDKVLSVWRQVEDRWTLQYKTVLKTTSPSFWGDYKLKHCSVMDLHPEKPEVVFFQYREYPECILSCNLKTGMGEPEFFSPAEFCTSDPCWRALRPRVSCWPTPIPRYEELRGLYDGSYDCWVQHNNDHTTTLPSTTIGKHFEFAFFPSLPFYRFLYVVWVLIFCFPSLNYVKNTNP
ncbi:unnamed protein product [Linum tenue]|uniref:F-box domain-containing protein n=1 Tax=Linum tenue TaxID=586396 RepID=A0AAV0PCT8_9ROSI|nr:unnamed protein product [Linum tenue]